MKTTSLPAQLASPQIPSSGEESHHRACLVGLVFGCCCRELPEDDVQAKTTLWMMVSGMMNEWGWDECAICFVERRFRSISHACAMAQNFACVSYERQNKQQQQKVYACRDNTFHYAGISYHTSECEDRYTSRIGRARDDLSAPSFHAKLMT